MIAVLIPSNFSAERVYSIEVLFKEFLGLSFLIDQGDTNYSAEISLQNGNRLLIEDYFFNFQSADKPYYTSGNIPDKIHTIDKNCLPFIPEYDLPIIFGTSLSIVSENEIICGVDILASIFFMLSRWEEYANPIQDKFQRFPANESCSVKSGFHDRPIVDEYVETVWNMLTHLGITQQRKKREFTPLLTHDVDYPLLWLSPKALVKKIGGAIFKRGNITEAISHVRSYFSTLTDTGKDPYDTFDYLMNLSENHGIQSYFFFLSGGSSKYDIGHLAPSHPFIAKLINNINARNHNIGFHPSFNSFNDKDIFCKELDKLKIVSPQKIRGGRQHFLRFKVPYTWRIWEDSNLEFDSSMYFAEKAGFRCGTCHPFPVFDILDRKQLNLKELPLTVMEMTYMAYQKKQPKEAFADIKMLLNRVKKYNGNFVFLWHNTSFNTSAWEPYRWVYESILKELKN